MPHHQPPTFLVAIWFAFVGFITGLFRKSPSAARLPIPVTTRPSKAKPNSPFASPTSASVRVTRLPWAKGPSPLKRPKSAASPFSSTARTSSHRRSRSATPTRAATDPEYIFHPPPSPFPKISLSGIFATPPLSASPSCLASDIVLAPLSLASLPDVQTAAHIASPGSPSPSRGSHGSPTPSIHTLDSRSPRTPSDSSSAVIVHLDRSAISPTTMSDGSLEIILLGDQHGVLGPPVKVVDIGRLPSPWSPIGNTASSDVWMSADGTLVNATGPVVDTLVQDNSKYVMSRTSLYSSASALDALGITVLVNLDDVGDQGNIVGTTEDPSSVPKLCQVHDENHPTLVTPRKRQDTLPSASYSAPPSKRLSTPLTKLDNVGVSHVRSATSISSMAYELRMGLFADGRSITAFENIISLLDQVGSDDTEP